MNLVVSALSTKGDFDRGDSTDDSKLIVAACLNSGGNTGGFRTEPGEHLTVTGPLTTGYSTNGHGRAGVNDQEIDSLVAVDCYNGSVQADQTQSLRAGNGNAMGGVPSMMNGAGVRRLTPTECERLQGFPDGWTCLCQPLASYDSGRCVCPDGPRYKTLGKAVTVPVIRWIGKNLMRHA